MITNSLVLNPENKNELEELKVKHEKLLKDMKVFFSNLGGIQYKRKHNEILEWKSAYKSIIDCLRKQEKQEVKE